MMEQLVKIVMAYREWMLKCTLTSSALGFPESDSAIIASSSKNH